MNGLEYLQRLDSTGFEERWLVTRAGRALPHVAWFVNNDTFQVRQIEQATRAWMGPIHPRVSAIETMWWYDEDLLVIESDDDRGPSYCDAAAQLTDPNDRERWSVAQLIAMADGLAALRQRDKGFVHRRLEPERMFVDESGHAKLRAPITYLEQGPRPAMTGAAVIMGVPYWMSPEQARGTPVTATSDVFALASLLYYTLSGRRPFGEGAESPMEALVAIIQTQPQPLQTVTQGLWRVIERGFEKDASKRYPDPGTFAGELWQCVPDAAEYDAVISDRIVAWRANAADVERGTGAKPCRMKWDDLVQLRNPEVRMCHGCSTQVIRANSLAQVFPLLGHCVAYRGGD